MSTVVDELVTRMTLDPKGYQSGANQVLSTTNKVASGLGTLTGTLIRGVTLASVAGMAEIGRAHV